MINDLWYATAVQCVEGDDIRTGVKMTSLRSDLQTSFRADGAAFMDMRSGNLYALNTSAALIAECLRDGQSAEEAASVLVTQYGLTQERAIGCVTNFIEQCRVAGLLVE